MTSIKQQLYATLVAQVTGVNWYGSDDNTSKMGPPPAEASTPWGYLQFTDVFNFRPRDPRAVIEITIGDIERRQYTRINEILTKCDAVFAHNPETDYVDAATGELWYYPEMLSWSGELEDFDRPGILIRTADYMFRKRIKAAMVAATT